MKTRVRIAPSPTGDPHVGTAYIALFNYVFAKQNKGSFIIRIEDTDRDRYNELSEAKILKYLDWLGLKWSEGPDISGPFAPYKQSERTYVEYVQQLLDSNHAYYCNCSSERLEALREEQKLRNLPPGYDSHCRNLGLKAGSVVRFRMPTKGNTIVNDLLRGEIVFDNARIDDQVLLKSDGMPTYHLANVVDDHLMQITHVIRAEEWIPSTPKHILLYRAFGWQEPVWIHMPLLRNIDKSKISKRMNATSLEFYFDRGYLKEAMLNFLALMGWHPKENKEIFSLDEMIEEFSFERAHLGSPVFDMAKLNWINREYMKKYDLDALLKLLKPYLKDDEIEHLRLVINEMRNNADTLEELASKSKVFLKSSFEIYSHLEASEKERADKVLVNNFKSIAEAFITYFEKSNLTNLEESKAFLDELKKMGNVFPSIRLLISGSLSGLELARQLIVLPKEVILKKAKEFLAKVI